LLFALVGLRHVCAVCWGCVVLLSVCLRWGYTVGRLCRVWRAGSTAAADWFLGIGREVEGL
jgi:hypothetical protein